MAHNHKCMNPLITLYYNKHIQGARRKNMLMEGVWWGDAKITDFNQKRKKEKKLQTFLFSILHKMAAKARL